MIGNATASGATAAKVIAHAFADRNRKAIADVSDALFYCAELGMQEHESATMLSLGLVIDPGDRTPADADIRELAPFVHDLLRGADQRIAAMPGDDVRRVAFERALSNVSVCMPKVLRRLPAAIDVCPPRRHTSAG